MEIETRVAVDENEQEKSLGLEVTDIERQAAELKLMTDADYKMAGDLAKVIKSTQKRVDEYWEPMRAFTYAAYKEVTDHKKAMADPLKNAEAIIKRKMGQYQIEQERKRKEEEERLKALAREEMERKLKEAEAAENAGDAQAVENAMAEAEVMENVAMTTKVEASAAKVAGISQTKAWEITDIDLSKLPCTFGGILIRPADERAIMNIIKTAKGKIEIPGVKFTEKVSISVRVG